MKIRPLLLAAVTSACLAAPDSTQAETFRWARAGDGLTLDPHAQNEGPTHTLNHQIYEPLLHRNMAGTIIPALATEWSVTADPSVWEFTLRENVTFHNGNRFDADDVVFSIRRAKAETSGVKGLLASVAEVTKVDDHLVRIRTDGPNPILPAQFTNIFIMDEEWASEHGVELPQDFAAGEQNHAALNANGTGAFVLKSREAGVRTVLAQNPEYWGREIFPLEVTEIVYTPISYEAARIAALLSDEVDFIQDIPVHDLESIMNDRNLVLRTGPQNRTIFFGMNMAKKDLVTDDVEGKNPLAERGVREAMNIAIDREAIKRAVMRGQSQPAGIIIPPFVNGWTQELDSYPAVDIDYARRLMREAGYAEGFSIRLDCPDDRYVNDEAICRAVTGMLAQIGIRVELETRSKSLHFPLIANSETEFYLLGWGVPTFDSEYVFNFLYHSKEGDYGSLNATGYSDPRVDAKIKSLASETDSVARDATIAELWQMVKSETIYLPLHHQMLDWGMKAEIEFNVQPEDQPHFKFLTYRK